MLHRICTYLLLVSALFIGSITATYAQDSYAQDSPEREAAKVGKRMVTLLDELKIVESGVVHANAKELIQIEHNLSTLKIRWGILNNDAQFIIAAYDHLIEMVVQYEQKVEAINLSIEERKKWLDASQVIENAENSIAMQVENYRHMEQEALELSLLQQQAPLLEKLKLKEGLLFTSITQTYTQAMQAAQAFPEFAQRAADLEDHYIVIKSSSEKIQAVQFQPFMARIKDYLMTFAAVAILLMFANMVQAKIQAYKQMRKSMQEYKKMLNPQDEIPTI